MGPLRHDRIPPLLLLSALPLLALASWFVAPRAPGPVPNSSIAQPLPTTTATAEPTEAATVVSTPTLVPTATLLPTPGRFAAHSPGYVPILMYHYVREVDAAEDPLGYRLSVRPDRFAEQMAWLRREGYTPLTMRDLAACLRRKQACPERPAAVTFDDGYTDQFSNALPVLQRYNVPATFYIVTEFVGRPGYMTWAQVAELQAAGMEIGSHTLSHADLTGLNPVTARREIERSRTILETRLDTAVVSFSYPAGSHTGELAAAVHAAGYSNAVITAAGRHTWRLYELPRRRVLGGETIAGFPWYFVPADVQE